MNKEYQCQCGVVMPSEKAWEQHVEENWRIDGIDKHGRGVRLSEQPPLMLSDVLHAGQKHDRDMINSPPHYNSHPSGIECIQVTEHCSFCIGNAIKYLWRADEKGAPIEDLKKSIWYIQREIERRGKAK